MKLKRPVQVEVYPDHEDFAVRTAGMPGIGGILGVTFSHVVAMDSPSGRPPGSFHWASTLWHEMSHVFVLQATNSRVPRWFTEGLAVYEETAASPDWGDRLDPEAIHAIQNKKLLPRRELDRGFIRPSYPAQVIVSYFQGGKICSFIAEKWGYSKLLDMIHSFAKLESTPDVIQKDLGISTDRFRQAVLRLAGRADQDHGGSFRRMARKTSKTMVADVRAKKYDDVISIGDAIRRLLSPTTSSPAASMNCRRRLHGQGRQSGGAARSSKNTTTWADAVPRWWSAWRRWKKKPASPRKPPPRSIV